MPENSSERSSKRVLEPIDRVSEILFGLIMVLTFTGSLSIAEAGRDDVRTNFWAGAVAMVMLATLTAVLVTMSGRSAWFVGVLVLIVYLMFATALYLLPPSTS